jgi:hypothetical protein
LTTLSRSEALRDVDDDLILAAIEEATDKGASYARSAAEAAWRGERRTLGVHLAQLRLTTIEAIRLFKSLRDVGEAEVA